MPMKSALLLLLSLAVSAEAQNVAHPFFAQDAAAADECTQSNLFLEILAPNPQSSSSVTDNQFYCQKIKNLSSLPVTIMRYTTTIQTNDAFGVPTWTAYVRNNPAIGSGSTYGSPSITTNRHRGITSAGSIDFFWTPGTEPVVPANTDFYIGMTRSLNGANSTTVPYEVGSGTGDGYIDTNYIAYVDGTGYGGGSLRDFAGEIWACIPVPECNSSNLWSSPISQSQLLFGNYYNMAVNSYGCQHIHNTSSSSVIIKKLRFGLESQGVGAVNLRAVAKSVPTLYYGLQYGGHSQVLTLASGAGATLYDFVWDPGYEPIIPANTDFYIGVYPDISNRVMIRWQNANVYETTSYSLEFGFDATPADMAFEIYICD